MKKEIGLLFSCVFVGLYLCLVGLEMDPLQPMIAKKILRFHVLANSNSDADQEIKLKVRDAVGAYLGPVLEETNSLEETKEMVKIHTPSIIRIAEATLREYGYEESVSARITKTYFPEKRYGEFCFPKGNYEALQIIIGEGEGQNWWCVLYPNMCFKGSVYEVVEEDAKIKLKEVLSPWEYADVFQSGEVKLRFKLLEYLKD